MSTTEVTVDSILGLAQELSPVERYELAMAILETLREPLGAPKSKRSRKAAASADGEPKAKREPTSWDRLRAQVSATIKGVEGFKQQHVMKFASFIKAKPEMSSEAMLEEYNEWLKSDVSSVSSGGSKASTPKEPKPELTEDEKDAKRKATAEKRKATIAAKKAAAAAAAEAESESDIEAPAEPKKESVKAVAAAEAAAAKVASTPFDDEEELEEEEINMIAFEFNSTTYARYEKDDKVYLYTPDGQTYVGELKGKKKQKIDSTTPNPLA
jgi:hypothetical protein